MDAWVERVVAGGDANTWVVGDERECAVVDPAGEVVGVLAAIGDRPVRAIICTHAHGLHVAGAVALAEATGALVFLHADDYPLWVREHPARKPDVQVVDGLMLDIGGVRMEALHTPGHTPGSTCWWSVDLQVVFTGDTLGAAGPVVSPVRPVDLDVQVASIRRRLFALPNQTVVHPGHGPDTTVSTQRWRVEFWR
jgi:glyoxylase-like metal-dependent hydrolase (beta-lactamase superfamily II)